MREWRVKVCEHEFDRMVEDAREDRRRLSLSKQVPVIGGVYDPKQHAELVRKVARALAFQERHAETVPYSWARKLPVRMEECESLIDNKDNALKLLGYFGRSLWWNGWPEQHPTFEVFCCGVTEYVWCPPELQMDLELQKLFPPKALAGITTPLQWRSPR